MSSPVIFDRPLVLMLLPVVLVTFWAIARHSAAGLHPAARRRALVIRCCVATLLLLALAGMHLVRRSNDLTTIFVLDVSRSIRPDQRAQALAYIREALASKGQNDQAGVVVFGRTPYLEDAPSDTLQQLDGIHASVAGDATDLASALRLAEAAFPADTGHKIVLLSDGNENRGDASGEVETLRADGVRVDVAPTALGAGAIDAAPPEAMVDDVDLPTHARTSAPFDLRVVVSSTVPQKATLALQRDGQPLGRQAVILQPGKNAFTFPQNASRPGFHRYDAVLNPTADGISENNHGFGYISVLGKPRVLYIAEAGSAGSDTLRRAMAAQDIDIEVRPPGALPSSVAELASYDSVVLSDVPASEIGPGQMTALEEASKEFGVGLGMIGGPNSFGAGQYGGTPIETALPVKMDVHSRRRLPSAAVVVVLDASGSMAATEDGVEKVQLGARAAVQLMGALQPDDQVAVTAVTETSTVVVPLESASKAAAAGTAIESVHAGGGGIYCHQGLSDAYALLLESHAPIKHVILCADTSDSEQQDDSVAMARDMLRQHHISTTVCGIGHEGDQHVPFQRALARAGNGQLFIVNAAADLPRLFQRDVQTIQQSWFIERPTLPKYDPSDAVLSGVPFATAPPLLGYNLTTPKPGATVALASSGQNDPLLAYWRFGLGRTFAFTSDDRAHWAVQWLSWPGYARFWAQVLRWSLRSNAAANFQTSVSNKDGKGHLVVEAFTQNGGFVNKAVFAARVVAPDLSATRVPLAQTAPGRYEGSFDADQTGGYLINVRRGSAIAGAAGPLSQTIGFVVPYSPEYRTLGPNLSLLTELTENTGGTIQPDPTRVFRDAETWVVGVVDPAPVLLLLTALLFVADIALRRLVVRPSAVRAAAHRGAEVFGVGLASVKEVVAPRPVPLSEPQADQLLGRNLKNRVREPTAVPLVRDSVLSRRFAGSEDDPFPQVASLYGKPKPLHDAPPAENGYAERIAEAQRRAERRDD